MMTLVHRIHSFRRWQIGLGLIGLGLLILLWWGWVPADGSNPACQLAENGAWISVDWTSQPVDETAVAQLARDASKRRLRYLFPFTTYVKADGTFSPSYAHAADFVSTFRRFNQDTHLLAWIGVPVQNDRYFGIHGWVNLADETERHRIVTFVAQLVDEAGFDGVHLNIEHVNNNDPHYLLLLEEVKMAIGPQHILSVASNDWGPTLVNALPVIGGYKWSDEYFQAVAERVDQIVTMTYDSFMPHPALYRLWMREEVRGLNKSLAGLEVQLLVGLSISREDTTTHHPQAENMSSGLAGICAGISALPQSQRTMQGVAIYAAWEATPTDWQIWEEWVID